MKKVTGAGVLLILCMCLLFGCSKKTSVDTATVFIEKKGQIVSVDVETLDKDYYNETELEEYINDHVTDYVEDNGETVELTSFEVTDGVAKLQMKYDSYEDYSRFNGIDLYTGTVVTALAAGYDFDVEFSQISKDSDVQMVSRDEVLANDEYKVAIIKANVNVQVPGSILYVSSENTKVVDKHTVSIVQEEAGEEVALTYIIYK